MLKDFPNAEVSEVAEREAYLVLYNESLDLQDDGSGMAGSW